MHPNLIRLIMAGLFTAVAVGADAAAIDRGTLTVFGIDRTEPENKGMTAAGIAVADHVLKSLADGNDDGVMACAPTDGRCRIQIRWISDVSYAPTELVTEMSLSRIDQPANAFDGSGKRRRYVELQTRRAELARALRVLRALQPNPKGTQRTDLFGFLQAASEYFSQSATATKVLIYVSDLEDNEHFRITPDLQGVDVQIYAVAWRADPVAMQRLQSKWRKVLTEKCRAKSVTFLPLPITSYAQ